MNFILKAVVVVVVEVVVVLVVEVEVVVEIVAFVENYKLYFYIKKI
jgi:hypothetical protein